MAALESPTLSLDDCFKLEEKILSLGGDFRVLEDHYRQLVERNPDIGGGAELIDGLGMVLIYPRLTSKAEVDAGGCSPAESLSFFGDCIQGVTLFSDWSYDGSLWPVAEAALEPEGDREFGMGWRCQFAHAPPGKIPAKFRVGGNSSMETPGIFLRQNKNDGSFGEDLALPRVQKGSIMMSAGMTQDYWKLHQKEFRVALEKIRHLPDALAGWEDATFTDGGKEFWGACRLPHHDSAEELHAKLTAAARYCFGDDLSSMESLAFNLEPDADYSIDSTRDAVTELLANVSPIAWSHWLPHNGGCTSMRKLSSLRAEISRFPMIFEGEDRIAVLISSLNLSGENIVFRRLYKQGGNVLAIEFLRRRKINPAVHKELEEILGIPLAPA